MSVKCWSLLQQMRSTAFLNFFFLSIFFILGKPKATHCSTCIPYINIIFNVSEQLVIFILLFFYLPCLIPWECWLSEWSSVYLHTCRSRKVAELWGMPVFTRVNIEQDEDIAVLLWHLCFTLSHCFVTTRILGGGKGCLISPVSISASQNINEMCPAERLPFT